MGRPVTSYHLEHLLAPRSVAVVGASDRPGSVGGQVMRNVLGGGFRGPVWPVNRQRATVAGRRAYAQPRDLPAAPDLALICTPAPGVPALIDALGELGTGAAVVLSGGLEASDGAGGTLKQSMLQSARRHGLRLLGPNCIGLLVPGIGLNASFAHVGARRGDIAFIAQSGALTTAMLDWADAAGVGFSHCISLGNAADVDFGDLLDYLGKDPHTRAILLYIEAVTGARKFMSAARAAARNKPVIAVKAGRTEVAARAATSHSGALAGRDAVYEAALRRAGVLRVRSTRQLFEAAQVLAQCRSYVGPRLAIVSNGGGPAVLATDALIEGGGQLATLSAATLAVLQARLPAAWSGTNPVDIVGDALPERYVAALEPVMADPGVDAVLLLHAPTALASTEAVAEACRPVAAGAPRALLTCWLGAERRAPRQAVLPGYATPEEAIDAFLHLVRYHQVQALLLETPASLPPGPAPDTAAVRAIVAAALERGQEILSEPESKQVLAAYGVPVVETRIAREAAQLPGLAATLGYPVVLKILSPDITHKTERGGVALDLATPEALERAAADMLRRCAGGGARLEGFTVQKMVRRAHARELLAGIATDATFGPVILFGQGGIEAEVTADCAIGLPPLTAPLARELMRRTRVAGLLGSIRGGAPVDRAAIEHVLVQLGRLASEVPELAELDINPLLADAEGVLALDARIRLAVTRAPAAARLAIRPYPNELEERVLQGARRVLLRPIRPEDTEAHRHFLAQVSPEDLTMRFFAAVRELPAADLAHLTQIDYDREMAFVAVDGGGAPTAQILGVARASADPDNIAAEFAVLVRSDLKRQGLGSLLLRKLIGYCRARGLRRLWGAVRAENTAMLQLAAALGFSRGNNESGCVQVTLELQQDTAHRT